MFVVTDRISDKYGNIEQSLDTTHKGSILAGLLASISEFVFKYLLPL